MKGWVWSFVYLGIFLCSLFPMNTFAEDEPLKRVMVLVPESFDDIEFSSVVSILRRANIDVVTVGIETLNLVSAAKIQLTVNRTLDKIQEKDFDALVILGSPSDTYYDRFPVLQSLVQNFNSSDRIIAAISLAPLLLSRAGVLYRRYVTVDPLFSGHLRKDAIYTANEAVLDGNIITGFAPGNSMEFSLLIVKALRGEDVAESVRRELFL